MNMKIAAICVLLLALAVVAESKIRILNEKNLAQFAKDNSYWLVQISSKDGIIKMENVRNARNMKLSWNSWITCSREYSRWGRLIAN